MMTRNGVKWALSVLFLVALFMLPQLFARSRAPAPLDSVLVAHLSRGDTTGLASIREAFVARNPGYDLGYLAGVTEVPPSDRPRVAFVQEGEGIATLAGEESEFSVGDILLLGPNESFRSDSLLSLLVFEMPEPLPEGVPAFIRPDWDPLITDTPGGCATDPGAYRRILLTWREEVGPYVYHALNAHRVRITDSFSHYHPREGGFDEFYLVQLTTPEARLFTSEKLDRILRPTRVRSTEAAGLIDERTLEVGDLVYLPRGVVHRGFGDVVAQVITVPGFIPGAEIGVDHHLREISERLSLKRPDTLPFNVESSDAPVVR
jgi:mannose-6-phosphate isomerase-like protein (cupin superfamily)